MTEHKILQPGTGALNLAGQLVDLQLLTELQLDPQRPFYSFVLTYLVASAGLTPIYDIGNYPNFLDNTAGVFPGNIKGHVTANLSECVELARRGILEQRAAEISLMSMLANSACESIQGDDYKKIKDDPVFQVLRHVRNAASHRNKWFFESGSPSRRAEWGGIVIEKAPNKSHVDPRNDKDCFYNDILPGDLLALLRDVEALLAANP